MHSNHFPHHPKYSSWWWSSGQDYGDSLISLKFNTSNMIIIGLCIGFAIVTEICIIGAVKWWRNVATLWHFALLPLLRKVAATHHFVVVTLCLHWYVHIPAQSCTAHTLKHTHCTQRCTRDKIVHIKGTLHNELAMYNITSYTLASVETFLQEETNTSYVAQVIQKTWTQLFLNVMPTTLVDHLLGSITMQLVPWR